MTDDDLDEYLRALAHRERRMFLLACSGERRSAGDLAERSNLSLATVSEHLKVLRKTGMVHLEKEGRFWFYQANAERIDGVIDRLTTMRAEMINGA
jgi:DNA-binding transcriptional ArsR family regulator